MKIGITNNVSWQIYEETVYIIDERTELMYKFDGPGYLFWKALLVTDKIEEITKEIAEYYNVPCDVLGNDLLEFVKELKEQGIVEEKIYDYR